MSSAFVSYAHEDREFVFALVEHLIARDLDIRYDQIALRVGDSLIERISGEIAAGDFLIAVVSLQSAWCRRELALAMVQGINERRVKVLPVRVRGAPMPPALEDTYWADGDRDDAETLARRLAAAMQEHLSGRDDDAARAAAEAQERGSGPPAHAEVAGDVGVAQIDDVAQRVWDVFAAWSDAWAGEGNIREVGDPQRRLRWALDALPEHVRSALPHVSTIAEADIGNYFASGEPSDEVEADIRAELTSVRRQVALGLPVRRRWLIDAYLGPFSAGRRDASAHLWQIARGDETFRIAVYISGTVLESSSEGLPPEVAAAKDTNGRSVVATLLALDEPPPEVMASTSGIRFSLPE